MTEIQIELFGERILNRRLLRMSREVVDHRDAFRRVAKILEHAMARNFATQGAYGGARWADLAPSTIRQKAASKSAQIRSNARRVLMATGRLAESLTSSGAGHVEMISADEMRWGSAVPYGRFHQRPGGRLPHRPLRLPEHDRRQIVREIQASIMGRA